MVQELRGLQVFIISPKKSENLQSTKKKERRKEEKKKKEEELGETTDEEMPDPQGE
ncbi:hypothetical protein J6590_065171 [Homalodisca vitripennis]|nr:hypothetical protein J6590_065171 [Homalodisca vitripennis]